MRSPVICRVWIPVVALGSASALAQEMPDMRMREPGHAGKPAIILTINPEARVSAVLGEHPLPALDCQQVVTLQMKIVNQGAVTAPLHARLIDAPIGVSLDRGTLHLTGNAAEEALLHVISHRTTDTDLTIAFSFTDNSGDLAGRDGVHFLLRCR
jgi:hypothetical protein